MAEPVLMQEELDVEDQEAEENDEGGNLAENVVQDQRVDANALNPEARIVRLLLPYLTIPELKAARTLTRTWNQEIIRSRKFRGGVTGHLRTIFYEDVKLKLAQEAVAQEAANNAEANGNGAQGFSNENTIRWHRLSLHHFKVYTGPLSFKSYWPVASSLLTSLTIENCSFQCIGFRFLLDYAPHLASLSLKTVRLRDVQRLHAEGEALAPLENVGVPPPPIVGPLKHLAFEDMYLMGGCFFDYLVQRTGALESISVKNCFTQELPLADIPQQHRNTGAIGREVAMVELLNAFHDDFVILLERNAGSLKSLTLMDIKFLDEYLLRLHEEGALPMEGAVGPTFPFPEKLQVSITAESHRKAAPFFNHYCKNVKDLTLHLMNSLRNEDILAVMNAVNPNVERLLITVNGSDSAARREQIDVDPALGRFQSLKSFGIHNRKLSNRNEKRSVRIARRLLPHRLHHGRGGVAGTLVEQAQRLDTKVALKGVLILPPPVHEISIKRIFHYTNIFVNARFRDGFAERFKVMTKLEIVGPWFFPLGEVLQIMYREGDNLSTLILASCGVTDPDVTGLNAKACHQIQRALTYVQENYLATEGDYDRQQFAELVEAAPGVYDERRPMNRRAPDAPPQIRMSRLPRLEHLDLSFNYGVSDVSIYTGMVLPRLKCLSLKDCYKVTDLGLEVLTMNCPNLEVLNIKNLRSVSQFGIDNVVRRCRKIKTIYTTKVIGARKIPGFVYKESINYGNIVKTTILTPQAEADQKEDLDQYQEEMDIDSD